MGLTDWLRANGRMIALMAFCLILLGCQDQKADLPIASGSESSEAVLTPSPQTPPITAELATPHRSTEIPILFHESLEPQIVEEQANALRYWKQHAQQKPVLIVFSAKVMRLLPDVLQKEAGKLLTEGRDAELFRRVARPVADQILAADYGLPLAMNQGWVAHVVWVVPLEKNAQLMSLTEFKKVLGQGAGGWGPGDLDTLKERGDGGYAGVLAGVPVEVVSVDRLPSITAPVLVHFDSGFFATIYKNEVKTPLSVMLIDHFKQIAERKYKTLGVTVSRDNQSFEVPLSMRFLGEDIADYIVNSERIRQLTPAMKLRAEMRYLDSFFQPDVILKKAVALVEMDNNDADSHYAMYRALRQSHQLDQGFAALDKAVQLDPVYADEYIELVNHAEQKQQHEAALKILDKAILALPDNQLVRLRQAQLLVRLERWNEAVGIMVGLQKLPWSEFYYPSVRQDLDAMLPYAKGKLSPRVPAVP